MENSLINDIFKIYHLDEEGNIKNIFIFTGEIPIIHDEKGWFLKKIKLPYSPLKNFRNKNQEKNIYSTSKTLYSWR